jgi:hypothetical protein
MGTTRVAHRCRAQAVTLVGWHAHQFDAANSESGGILGGD